MRITTKSPRVVAIVLFLVGFGFGSRLAEGQYYGRNKVQYKHFDHQILKTEHFDIYYYPEEQEAVEQAGRMAERWYARLSHLLKHQLTTRQPIILYADHADFEQTNAIEGELGEGTGGVTEPYKRRVVLPLAGPLSATDHVLGHELVHAFQFDITEASGRNGLPAAEQLPLWLIEGMAEYFSLGPVDANTAMWIRDAAGRNKLPTVHQLNDTWKYFPYRYGQALLAYIAGRWNDEALGKLLTSAAESGNVEKAIEDVLGVSAKQLSDDWHQSIHDAYDPIAESTKAAGDYGPRLIAGKEDEGELNVAPVLSPDGKKLVFFSSRNLFSVDLFLADAETGKIVRKVTNRALDAHFSSLEFIESAGSWDGNGRRLVFPAVSSGRTELVIFDVMKGHVEKEIPFPALGQIYDPAWSPDGRQIAFSASEGGLLDLFLYDLETGDLRRMTRDEFAELQPAWSPDAQTLAFVTDRFGSDLPDLNLGKFRLARVDVSTGHIEALPSFPNAKNINPQWSPDGESIYFLSDPNGITNVYRALLSDGRLLPVTNLYTGVSGITAASPALSVARQSNTIAFSVYESGQYDIYTVQSPPTLSGSVEAPAGEVSAAVLPPQNRSTEGLLAMLSEPSADLPSGKSFKKAPYHPHLSLDYAAQPYIVAGADPFGAFLGGGTTFFWSDMFGEHNLSTQVQVNGGYRDIAAIVGYENRTHRWNWGGVVEQIPYVSGFFSTGLVNDSGLPVYVEQQDKFRQTYRLMSGVVSYPASPVQRVELSGGLGRISFDEEIDTTGYDAITGTPLFRDVEHLPAPDAMNLVQSSAALVYDNSYFGATSPVLGQRYRLEVRPTTGTLDFVNTLADYRRYFMPYRPYTLAARIMHYGRYGSGAEDHRLLPLFLGYPNLVRGYDYNSFSADECVPNGQSDCPVFDRLLGSRMMVGNFELRFPIYGAFRHDGSFYGPLPVEAAIFADAGVAWTSGESPSFFGGDRKPVASAGLALRANAFGFAIVEVDFVHPFDRPEKSWLWQFNFLSGF